jgi:hypothetical protein
MSSTHSPPCKPVSSASSRRAASSGDFVPVDETGRQLEQARADGSATLTHERQSVFAVDSDDRCHRRMHHDVAAVAPLDAEDRPLVQRHRQDPDACPGS